MSSLYFARRIDITLFTPFSVHLLLQEEVQPGRVEMPTEALALVGTREARNRRRRLLVDHFFRHQRLVGLLRGQRRPLQRLLRILGQRGVVVVSAVARHICLSGTSLVVATRSSLD